MNKKDNFSLVRSTCCNVKVKIFKQYGGTVQYDVCSKCGKPQGLGRIINI